MMRLMLVAPNVVVFKINILYIAFAHFYENIHLKPLYTAGMLSYLC